MDIYTAIVLIFLALLSLCLLLYFVYDLRIHYQTKSMNEKFFYFLFIGTNVVIIISLILAMMIKFFLDESLISDYITTKNLDKILKEKFVLRVEKSTTF